MAEAVGASSANLSVSLSVAEAVGVAIKRLQAENHDDAEAVLDALADVAPDDADVLHFRGILAHRRGQHEKALRLLRRAVEVDPEYVDAHSNLGNVYKEVGDLENARAAYDLAIKLNPKHVAAHNNLGVTLRALGHPDAAVEVLLAAIELSPENADILQNLGSAYRTQRNYPEAIECYRKSIAIRPYSRDAYRYLAFTLYAMNEPERAIALVRQWLDFDPDNPIAKHLLAAYGGAPIPDRAEERYVRELFEDFAGSFEQVLAGIHYRAPEHVAERLNAAFPAARTDLNIIDAGCGTGLCGPLVRSRASTLIGVDLSPKMLARAFAKNVYDKLIEAEISAFLLDAAPRGCDAIISAEALCYFGSLETLFSAAFRALAEGGVLIFTVEKDDGNAGELGYRLCAHGRYSHALPYLERTLGAAGYEIEALQTQVLRREIDSDVDGFVITARKPEFAGSESR